MSNHLAIATVTAALRQVLTPVVAAEVGGAEVTTRRPDSTSPDWPPAQPGVNLFLYQATPNTAWRNADLPTRNGAGYVVQRPLLALDLHYLLTFHGDQERLEPERLMGRVVSVLHAAPLLDRATIDDAIAGFAGLATSDLAEAIERVKFSPLPLSLEELSKLWSVLFQAPYHLSMTYTASVVLIEADVAPRVVLPVRVRDIRVAPFRRVHVHALGTAADAAAPVQTRAPVEVGALLVVQGEGFVGGEDRPPLMIRVGEATLVPTVVRPTELRVLLAGAEVRAGIQGVRVVFGTGAASNTLPLVLRPRIAAVAVLAGGRLRVTLVHAVGERQHAQVLLTEQGGAGAFMLPAAPRPVATPVLEFDRAGVPSGDYLLRVEVGGAESLLESAPDLNDNPLDDPFVAPVLTLP